MKPVFRWTIGNCKNQGVEILAESVRRAIDIYEDAFDWTICYNGLSSLQTNSIVNLSKAFNVKLYKQHWHELPILQNGFSRPVRLHSRNFDWNGSKSGGTVWKLCPPRINLHVHEIICDNDIVMTDRIPEVDLFLKSNRLLILKGTTPYYGLFARRKLHDASFNSGLIGLPPKFDFVKHLYETYEEHDVPEDYTLTQVDEQGLVATVFCDKDPIVIYPNVIVPLFSVSGKGEKHLTSYRRLMESLFSKKRKGYHFCQSNRLSVHPGWEFYKNVQKRGSRILKDFDSKEVEIIAKNGYVAGYYGTKDLAVNWSREYAKRREV